MSRHCIAARLGIVGVALALAACSKPVQELEPDSGSAPPDSGVPSADAGLPQRACPLTLGVCASAHSLLVDGGWTPCDYGPDYQSLETRCDGLDNDCDGRVDTSTPVPLPVDTWGEDGGRLSRLTLVYFSVRATDAGIVLSAPGHLSVLDATLHQEWAADFPDSGALDTIVSSTGAHWSRVVRVAPPASATESCVALEDLAGGTGPAREVARACWPASLEMPWPTIRAHPRETGWDVLLTAYDTVTASPFVGWAFLGFDAGVTTRLFDATALGLGAERSYFPSPEAAGDDFVITFPEPLVSSTTPARAVTGRTGDLSVLPDVAGVAYVSHTSPLFFWTTDVSADFGTAVWLDADGGTLYPRSAGGDPTVPPWDGPGNVGIGFTRFPDGGSETFLTSVGNGGATHFSYLPGSAKWPLIVQRVSPELVLSVWTNMCMYGDPGCTEATPVGTMFAQLACLPR
jgi:hypothetical protein